MRSRFPARVCRRRVALNYDPEVLERRSRLCSAWLRARLPPRSQRCSQSAGPCRCPRNHFMLAPGVRFGMLTFLRSVHDDDDACDLRRLVRSWFAKPLRRTASFQLFLNRDHARDLKKPRSAPMLLDAKRPFRGTCGPVSFNCMSRACLFRLGRGFPENVDALLDVALRQQLQGAFGVCLAARVVSPD